MSNNDNKKDMKKVVERQQEIVERQERIERNKERIERNKERIERNKDLIRLGRQERIERIDDLIRLLNNKTTRFSPECVVLLHCLKETVDKELARRRRRITN